MRPSSAGGSSNADGGTAATIYLLSGESVTLNVPGVVVPSPGVVGLRSLAGLITVRRRR